MTINPKPTTRGLLPLLAIGLLVILVCSGSTTAFVGFQIGLYVAITGLILIAGVAVSSLIAWLLLRRTNLDAESDFDAQEFYDADYAESNISFDTCQGVLQVLRVQLNMTNVRPKDNLTTIFPEIDLSEICFDIGEQFDIKFTDDVIYKMDGTVDSVIRTAESLMRMRDDVNQ